jgi:hypothetical protein
MEIQQNNLMNVVIGSFQQNNPIKIENFMDTIFLDFYNHHEQKIFTLEQISHFTPEDKFNYILSKYNLLHTPIYQNRYNSKLYNMFLVYNKNICEEFLSYINNEMNDNNLKFISFYNFSFPLTISDICPNSLTFIDFIVKYENFIQEQQQSNNEYSTFEFDDYKTGEITGKSIGGGNNLLIYILVIIIILLLLFFFVIK